jgi:hypothetical protein
MHLVTALVTALPLMAAGATPATADPVRGTYRARADVRLAGVPLVSALELRGDVVLRPAGRPGALTARLAARGSACELAGQAEGGGGFALTGGQRCTIVLVDPDAKGRVEATLVAGRGTVTADGRLTLVLELALAGAVRVASGTALPGIPAEVDVPVNGRASVAAEGTRDNSRAAEP